jgi:hypothetical protein
VLNTVCGLCSHLTTRSSSRSDTAQLPLDTLHFHFPSLSSIWSVTLPFLNSTKPSIPKSHQPVSFLLARQFTTVGSRWLVLRFKRLSVTGICDLISPERRSPRTRPRRIERTAQVRRLELGKSDRKAITERTTSLILLSSLDDDNENLTVFASASFQLPDFIHCTTVSTNSSFLLPAARDQSQSFGFTSQSQSLLSARDLLDSPNQPSLDSPRRTLPFRMYNL